MGESKRDFFPAVKRIGSFIPSRAVVATRLRHQPCTLSCMHVNLHSFQEILLQARGAT
jgi:hypothetical protein